MPFVVVDGYPGPLRGRGQPAVAGELVVAVELGYVHGRNELRRHPRPYPRYGLQVGEVGVARKGLDDGLLGLPPPFFFSLSATMRTAKRLA